MRKMYEKWIQNISVCLFQNYKAYKLWLRRVYIIRYSQNVAHENKGFNLWTKYIFFVKISFEVNIQFGKIFVFLLNSDCLRGWAI